MPADDLLSVRPQIDLDDTLEIPRRRLGDRSVDPRVAYQLVHDELLLDGNSRLNLATFVTTWMEPEAQRLITECLDKNLVDKDEYPQSAELESRCVDILADLWHAPVSEHATGTSTSGSSEASMLGGMALLRRWRARRPADGAAARPNLVMGANVQVCWEKFCRYWDVEPRLVPVGDGTTHLTGD
ncbi:MAG: gadB, partial [Solirubrobacterales bacterium]|nr:gadB [Solirubrobacterales bacterium]